MCVYLCVCVCGRLCLLSFTPRSWQMILSFTPCSWLISYFKSKWRGAGSVPMDGVLSWQAQAFWAWSSACRFGVRAADSRQAGPYMYVHMYILIYIYIYIYIFIYTQRSPGNLKITESPTKGSLCCDVTHKKEFSFRIYPQQTVIVGVYPTKWVSWKTSTHVRAKKDTYFQFSI